MTVLRTLRSRFSPATPADLAIRLQLQDSDLQDSDKDTLSRDPSDVVEVSLTMWN